MKSIAPAPRVQRGRSPLPFGFGLTARPVRDNTYPRARPYGDDDATWWAAECDARDRAEEAARVEARWLESRAQEALDDGLWFDPGIEIFDHARMTEAAEAGLRI